MLEIEDAKHRSLRILNELRGKADIKAREAIEVYNEKLDFKPLCDYMICADAWHHVTENLQEEAKFVFAHPALLQKHPKTSLYYRGLCGLPQKRVQKLSDVSGVTNWERGSIKNPISNENAKKVACLYNTIISSLITRTTDWTLENGYRTMLATMGMSLGGTLNNLIGQEAEKEVKHKLLKWAEQKDLIKKEEKRIYHLKGGIQMIYDSDPDIKFLRGKRTLVTIEIKGGKDPSGALERLGAAQKSFAKHSRARNFLIAGVTTESMRKMMEQEEHGSIESFNLEELLKNNSKFEEFCLKIFDETLEIYNPIPSK